VVGNAHKGLEAWPKSPVQRVSHTTGCSRAGLANNMLYRAVGERQFSAGSLDYVVEWLPALCYLLLYVYRMRGSRKA